MSIDWTNLAQDTAQYRELVNMAMNCWFSWNTENLLTNLTTISVSRTSLSGFSYISVRTVVLQGK
jgi:hypothetical protein